jgi:streptogramin lyase
LGGIVQALRRVDPLSGIPLQETIAVGSDPVAVVVVGGSVWVADRSDGVIERVDPGLNRVVATIAVGAKPTAIVSDHDGIWVATL